MVRYIEEHNQIPLIKEYDVIVVGGGIAGVSAAIAAVRQGSSTLLIEKSAMLGGLATLGAIAIYLPLCDGTGRQVIGGIAQELLHLSIKYGYGSLPGYWRGDPSSDPRERYLTVFSPPEFVIALDEYVGEVGLDLLFDTTFSCPILDGLRCQGVIVENKSGRQAYGARAVIDTTGDGDLLHRAGLPCIEEENWLSYWAYSVSLSGAEKALRSGRIQDLIHLETWGGGSTGRGAPTRKFKGTEAGEITEFILAGRRLVRETLSERGNGYSLVSLPGMAQLRRTRRLDAEYVLRAEDEGRFFADSIGCTGDWRQPGPVYEIPYRTLFSANIDNILTAGRCIGSQGDAWEVTRVIPTAALTGQAAGTAAALIARLGCTAAQVPIALLQSILHESGVLLHISQIRCNPSPLNSSEEINPEP